MVLGGKKSFQYKCKIKDAYILSFTYLFRKHKYKFTNTSIPIQAIILNRNMFAGSL